jgi:hypothetical protein
MAQVLFQIGNPGGDAHLVNDPGFIAEAEMIVRKTGARDEVTR